MSGPSSKKSSTPPAWPYALKRADGSPYEPPAFESKNAVLQWLEARLPIISLGYSAAVSYPTPRNLNYWWTFGAILTFMLMAQIVTGVILVMHYTANVDTGLQFHRAHHARRELRLAAALSALQRRLDVLPRRLHPHVPRHVLRLLQVARARCSGFSA